MLMNRKQLLRNGGWAASGAALGAVGQRLFGHGPTADRRLLPASGTKVARTAPAAEPALPPPTEADGNASFSQAGEDMIVRFFFQYRGIDKITYLDVGANDPIVFNNTYYFYRKGYRGVLVEPNVSLCEKLRSVRPGDTTLAAGIGVTDAREADYYVMTFDGLNTFSKEEAEHQVEVSQGRVSIKEVIKLPLRNINSVMELHFQGAPTFLSVDTEGMDLPILKSIDYRRYRPAIICAETLVAGTARTRPEIPEFMATQGYVVRGGSFVNTIFVDSKIL